MRNTLASSLLVILMFAVMASCSGAPDDGPGPTVQRFFDHMNTGDYDAAKSLYTAEVLAVLEDPEFSSDDSFRDWAAQLTRDGTIASVEISATETDPTDASTALVRYEIRFQDGSTQPGEVTLTEGESGWRLGLIG